MVQAKNTKKVGKGKKAAKAPVKKPFKEAHAHLFSAKPRNFNVGGSIQHKRDLTRFVRWPRYVRLQRQRAILNKRLKVPPSVNQFTNTLDRNQAANLFRLLAGYRPESKEQKKQRLQAEAEARANGAEANRGEKPKVIKFGINHVTTLVEEKKAQLVIIAHDVVPLELVVWLPALCRKMGVPYCIVKGKARLGHFVHQKTATALALVDVHKKDAATLQQLVGNFQKKYADASKRQWGGQVMGQKHLDHVAKMRKAGADI